MAKTNVPGYSFPRMPERWTGDEQQFGLKLRSLFDGLHTAQETNDRNFEKSTEQLNDLDSKYDKAVKETNGQIAEMQLTIERRIEEIVGKLADIDDTLDALQNQINDVGEDVYPIGITVLTNSGTSSPFDFGSWQVMTDIDDNPVQDAYGHYMWERVL